MQSSQPIGHRVLSFFLGVSPSPPPARATATAAAALPVIQNNPQERAALRIKKFTTKLLRRSDTAKLSRVSEQVFSQAASSADSLRKVSSEPDSLMARHREAEVRTQLSTSQSRASQEKPPLLPQQNFPLPPLHNIQDPDSPVTITKEQAQVIQDFVDRHRETWEQKDFPRTHYKSSEEHLPYSMDVFHENGELHIMVRCKQKEGHTPLGEGVSKTAKLAVDWETLDIYGDITLKSGAEDFEREYELAQKLGEQRGLARPFFGYQVYESTKTGSEVSRQKIAAYMPYYNNVLNRAIEQGTPLSPAQKREVFKDILFGLATLRKHKIEHGDFKMDNIFLDDAGEELHAHIFDFGLARSQASRDYTDYGRGGVVQYASPQKRRAADLLSKAIIFKDIKNAELKTKVFASEKERQQYIEETKAQIEAMRRKAYSFINETCLQNDAWSAGNVMLQLLEGRADPPPTSAADAANPELSAAQKIGALFDAHGIRELGLADDPDPLSPKHYPLFQAKVDEIIAELDSRLSDPADKETLRLVKQLLVVDFRNRRLPEEVLAQL